MSKEAKETETLEDAACKYFQFNTLDIEPGTPDWYRAEGINFASAWQSQHPTSNVPLIADVVKAQSVEEEAEAVIRNHPNYQAEGLSEYMNGYFNGYVDSCYKQLSKLPEIIKEVLKRAADNAKLRTYTVGSMLDEHFEVDKQSILNVNCDDLIK